MRFLTNMLDCSLLDLEEWTKWYVSPSRTFQAVFKGRFKIQTGKGQTIIVSIVGCGRSSSSANVAQTNDGNTMLKGMSVMHPAAKMLVDLSAAQDVEAGDGTTSVVVICGSLLGAADRLLSKGFVLREIDVPQHLTFGRHTSYSHI